MDVSIAVSLIRGQMGTVVERAVNGAVETVLAEMLKVVGVKFEELKAQVALMKRDLAALQREKALKEKENDNIRAKLRYTELKLKYYRQGVEEELQQRASASTLVRIHPSSFPQPQRGSPGNAPTETSPSCSAQECTSPQSTSTHATRARYPSDMQADNLDSSNLLLPVTLSVNTTAESLGSSTVLFCHTEQDTAGSVDTVGAPPLLQALTQSAAGRLSPDGSTQADSSTPPSAPPQSWLFPVGIQVKQEAQQEDEEEEEVICIKGEPEEEQEVMATLLLECQVQQCPESEAQSSEWSGLPGSQRTHSSALSSAGPSTHFMLQPTEGSMVALPSAVPPRQGVRPWTKDFSLYEEYKLRKNELRRRSLHRRRELEKSLPQPLLADLVRERREKTRLRVARWRAKRKLQACLNQAQAQSGTAGLSQAGFPVSSQRQEQLRASAASSSFPNNNNVSAASLPFISSTSSPSQLLRGPNMSAHQHAVTSTSNSSFPQVSLSQPSISLTDTDILP